MSLLQDALAEFARLQSLAMGSIDPEPAAMSLSTADAAGRVHSRIVLLKSVDESGFRFFTNYESAKGKELAEHAQVALCLHWKSIDDGIQVRIEGPVARVSAGVSDAYFASRPRGSQVGAWASLQSQTLPSREDFEARIAHVEERYRDGEVPRPPHWGGYCVSPDVIEFWYGARFRLHERMRYECAAGEWSKRMLYP
ncbi:MAG: pyridoxamine 5'-phosphate oxidase [Tahibacter sp.]